MNICLISKYPPIEGGESSKAYWMAKSLGLRGHNIHVVTNAFEVEHEFREKFTSDDLILYQPKNVFVHNTDPFEAPFFIPKNNPYLEKLSGLAIEVIRDNKIDIIDSWYLLPYGVAGLITSRVMQKPYIARHAGSDLFRLLPSVNLSTILHETLFNASRVITYPNTKNELLDIGVEEKKIFVNKLFSVDTNAFNPTVKAMELSEISPFIAPECPIITYIGKVGKAKGIYDLIKALSTINKDYVLVIVTSPEKPRRLLNAIENFGIKNKVALVDFVPPWKIPSIIKASTCVVIPENNFPIVAHNPTLPREVLAVGTCLMISSELYNKKFARLENSSESMAVFDPLDDDDFTKKLFEIISDVDYANKIGKNGLKLSKELENFDLYISSIINLYESILE